MKSPFASVFQKGGDEHHHDGGSSKRDPTEPVLPVKPTLRIRPCRCARGCSSPEKASECTSFRSTSVSTSAFCSRARFGV